MFRRLNIDFFVFSTKFPKIKGILNKSNLNYIDIIDINQRNLYGSSFLAK